MAENRDISTADVMAAAAIPNSRVSQITSGLSIRGRRTKGGPAAFTAEEATRIVLTRRLQELGLLLGAAVDAVQKVSFDDLKRVIVTDAPEWLVVFQDGHAEVCDGTRMLDLAEGRGGTLTGLRIANIHTALKDIFTAKMQRLRAMEQATESESIVSGYAAPDRTTGCFLHSDLRLCTFQNGKGLAVRLTPEAARSLAAQLLATADKFEAKPRPEDVH